MSDITRRAAIDKGVPAIITRDSGDADVTTPTEGTNSPILPTTHVDPSTGAAEAPAPAPTLAPVSDDVDDIELREARAAAKAEEAPAGTAQPAAVEGTAAPQPPTPAAAPAPQEPEQPAAASEPAAEPAPTPTEPQPKRPAMVPKARFDEVNTRASSAEERAAKAEQDAAYWRGRAEAQQHAAPGAAGQPPAPAPAPVQQTPEQRLAEIRSAKEALAKRFDDGEIGMVEHTRLREELDDKAQAIREEALVAKVKPQQTDPQPQTSGSDSLYLETLTSQLEEKHPWVTIFDKVGGERDWQFLEGEARANLTERGIPLNQGALSSYHLREEMARLADEYGPGMLTKRAQAKGIDLPKSPAAMQPPQAPPQSPAPAAPAPGQRTLSTVAAARAGKLEQAALAPPRMDTISGVPADSGLTESQLNSMSDDDIGALPDAVRRKALGIT